MKKIALGCFILSLLLLAGCGNNTSPDTTSNSGDTGETCNITEEGIGTCG